VSYIKDQSSMREMLLADDPEVTTELTPDELERAQEEAAEVQLPEKIVDTVLAVKLALEKAGFVASDRLWRKSLKLMQALAYLDGESEVTEDHMLILSDILWKDPKDRQALSQIVAQVANPIAHQVEELLDAARETFSKIPFNEVVEDDETSEVFNKIVDARVQFNKSIEKLNKLKDGKRPNNRIADALEELAEMKQEASRFAAEVAGA
jgi:MoxR-like ATPase